MSRRESVSRPSSNPFKPAVSPDSARGYLIAGPKKKRQKQKLNWARAHNLPDYWFSLWSTFNWLHYSLVHSLIHSFNHSFICPFIYSRVAVRLTKKRGRGRGRGKKLREKKSEFSIKSFNQDRNQGMREEGTIRVEPSSRSQTSKNRQLAFFWVACKLIIKQLLIIALRYSTVIEFKSICGTGALWATLAPPEGFWLVIVLLVGSEAMAVGLMRRVPGLASLLTPVAEEFLAVCVTLCCAREDLIYSISREWVETRPST